MSRALWRSLAVVALLAVVSAALVVVTPSLARIDVYGGTPAAPAAKPQPKTAATRHGKHRRRPYRSPVVRCLSRSG
jgi:hypothetical protein